MLRDHALPEASAARRALSRLGDGRDVEASPDPVFVDLETSGLGSAGSTCVFIVGAARYAQPDRLEIVQWTLRTIRAERAMLADVARTLGESAACIVTFNGSSFDLPMLRGRFGRLGIAASSWLRSSPHLDLLTVARRLGGDALLDYRLGTLERAWLGLRRTGDLEGAEIAAVFDDLVRRPADPDVLGRLQAAQAHNRLDVVSMPMLLAALARRLWAPPDPPSAVRAARHLSKVGAPQAALRCLEPVVHQVLAHAGGGPAWACDALHEAAELHRRAGRFEAAAALWRQICVRRPGDARAHEALAKHLEHRRRKPSEALQVAMRSAMPCPRRLARLRRKAGLDADAV